MTPTELLHSNFHFSNHELLSEQTILNFQSRERERERERERSSKYQWWKKDVVDSKAADDDVNITVVKEYDNVGNDDDVDNFISTFDRTSGRSD